MEINKNGFSFYVEKLPCETNRQLNFRCWYIVNCLIDFNNFNNINNTKLIKQEFENSIKKSIFFHNTKNLKCKYNKNLYDINLKKNEKNLYC